MSTTEDQLSAVASPRANALDYPDSSLDVVVRDDRAELLPDSARPIGNPAWITVDRDHLVTDLDAHR